MEQRTGQQRRVWLVLGPVRSAPARDKVAPWPTLPLDPDPASPTPDPVLPGAANADAAAARWSAQVFFTKRRGYGGVGGAARVRRPSPSSTPSCSALQHRLVQIWARTCCEVGWGAQFGRGHAGGGAMCRVPLRVLCRGPTATRCAKFGRGLASGGAACCVVWAPTDLEFVEVKHRNIIGEFCKGYLHLNFLVKGLDGKHTMFFAEVHHNLRDEKDVYLCKPLGEDDCNPSKKNDQARCKGCQFRAKDLIHPNCGSFIAGHNTILYPEDSDEEERDWDFI
ncbi:unnamed protein product [Miscanthus lutarioriparius]|uniref:DUF3615 domain-containing protein n=1 Tax=Miscanthus lutarioriparius TaxID=422564 RepID=A0A811RF48_9POAL|nr:unnamed protein product [Miscanthus lutarioriparius]